MQVIAISIIFTLCGNAFVKDNINSPQYSISPENASGIVGFSFLAYFLLLMRLLPLDLIINTEVSKIVLSKFMEVDAEMIKVDKETGEITTCKV